MLKRLLKKIFNPNQATLDLVVEVDQDTVGKFHRYDTLHERFVNALIEVETFASHENTEQLYCPDCHQPAGGAIFTHNGFRWSEMTTHRTLCHFTRYSPEFEKMILEAGEAKIKERAEAQGKVYVDPTQARIEHLETYILDMQNLAREKRTVGRRLTDHESRLVGRAQIELNELRAKVKNSK